MSSIQDTVALRPSASSSGQGLRLSLRVPVNFGDERLPERFWNKVQPCPMSGCWIWVGAHTRGGYGIIGQTDKGLTRCAHRFAYERLIGQIEGGLNIDHLCRVRCCVNPLHLEPVTQRENTLRGTGWGAIHAHKTHCKRGHEFTPANTYAQRTKYGFGRRCRACQAADARNARAAAAKRLSASELARMEQEIEEG